VYNNTKRVAQKGKSKHLKISTSLSMLLIWICYLSTQKNEYNFIIKKMMLIKIVLLQVDVWWEEMKEGLIQRSVE